MNSVTPNQSFDDLLSNLIIGIIQRYAQNRNLILALSWALPIILESIEAQAISLFLANDDKTKLQCEICIGPVDIKGLSIPSNAGLVGKAFTSKAGSLIKDAKSDANHYSAVDQKTGFETHSILTVPIISGKHCYGCLQAINRMDNGQITQFDESHLESFERLALILGVAFENLSLTEQMIKDALIKKDLSTAEETQKNLFASLKDIDVIHGLVIPARNLSGDFLDYFQLGDQILFCEGDVSGKGIPAALTVARCLALFRYMANLGHSPAEIAKSLNHEMYQMTERFESSTGFVTLFIGKFNLLKKTVEYLNCGHGNILIFNQNLDIDTKAASLPPIGIVSSGELNWGCEYINLEDKKMFVFTDGILEAKVKGTNDEIGLAGIISLIKLIGNLAPKEGISKIKNLFLENKLETSDDATMLILGDFTSNRY
jgi:sigma-B regulation protein RsbU (phosphoserine phosphatase)